MDVCQMDFIASFNRQLKEPKFSAHHERSSVESGNPILPLCRYNKRNERCDFVANPKGSLP